MRARGLIADEGTLVFDKFHGGLAGMIAGRHAGIENVPERHAGLQTVARQAENLAEPPVDDLQPVVLSNRQRPCDMLSSAASSRRLVPLSVSSCCLSRLMSLHTTIEPPSLVPLWLMRSQRPSASNASPVGGSCALRRLLA